MNNIPNHLEIFLPAYTYYIPGNCNISHLGFISCSIGAAEGFGV